MASIRLVLSLVSILMLATIVNASSSYNCSHTITGMLKMASGIDITKLDLFPLLGAPNDNHGFVANVFDYTCFRAWDPSENYNQVPDQMNTVNLPSQCSSEQFNFAQDMIGAKQLLMDRLDLKYDDERIGAFSSNSKYTSLLKQFYESDKAFTEITLPISRFMASNGLLTGLTEDFIQRAQKLPTKYEENSAIYREFVQRFGTHYFYRGYFTYDSYIQFALNLTYMFDTEDREMKENMKQSYLDWFKSDRCMNPIIASMVNDRFKKNGGIILAYGRNDSMWVDTVSGQSYESKDFENFRKPIMASASLMPMDGLMTWVDDLTVDNKNISLQSQMRIAIRMYRIEAYLNELKNVYNFSVDYQLSDKEKVTLKEVEQLISSNNVTQIEEMVEKIDELYNKVQLFKVKQFYGTILYDAYVTADVKLQFVKRVCAAKWMCPDSDIVYAKSEIEQLYQQYGELQQQDYEEYRTFVEKARELNVKFQIHTDQGWGFSCVSCWPF